MTNISVQGVDPSKTQKYSENRPSYARKLLGAYAGYVVHKAVTTHPYYTTNANLIGQTQSISNLQDVELEAVKKAIGQAFEASGLKEKGVKLIEVNKDNVNEAKKLLVDEYKNSIDRLFLRKKKTNALIEQSINQLLNGRSAFNLMHSNSILLPDGGKLGLATFHEMGHAATNLMGKAGKALRNSRFLVYFTTPILLAALLVDKKSKGEKSENEKPESLLGRGLGFVKKHAGKLAFLSWLPALLEEGLASVKGEKLAKPFLNDELFRKMKQVNSLGLTTYAIAALASGFGVYAAKTIRDAIVHNKKQDK